MAAAEIQIEKLRTVINAILTRLSNEEDGCTISVSQEKQLYWDLLPDDLREMDKEPRTFGAGSISDDMEFISQAFDLLARGENIAEYTLIHVAPVLRYIAERHRSVGPTES